MRFLRSCFVLPTGLVLASASAQTAPAGAPANQPAEVMTAFTVTTDKDNGYIAANAMGATRTNASIADTPQTISVFNDMFIEDTFSLNLTELADYNPAFEPTIADKGTYFSRGFDVNATFVDGMAQRNTFGPNYTANVDRVEFLQGPAAVLYGDGPAGATINRVLKRASPRRFTKLTATAGAYTLMRGTLDTNGPLGLKIAEQPISYRFNVALQDGNRWKLWSKDREQLYSPTFTIPLGRQTDLYVNFTYDKTNVTGTFAHPVTLGVPGLVVLANGTRLHVPVQHSMGEPFDDRPTTKTLSSYMFVHAFNEFLSLRSQYQFETYKQRHSEILSNPAQLVYTPTTVLMRRQYRARNIDYKADRAREELLGNVTTGPLKHRLLAGFSFDELNEADFYRQNALTDVPPIDLIHPVYGQYVKPAISTVPITTNTQQKDIVRAWYANDLIALFDERLFLQVGHRTEESYERTNNRLRNTAAGVSIRSNTTSAGFVYHPTTNKSVSLWGSVSSSFEPNFRVNPDATTLPPTTGKTYEGGVKLDVLRHTLDLNASVFHTERTNVPQSRPDIADGYFLPGPGQTSQGFEVSARYNPSRQLQLYGGYSYLDAFTTATKATLENAPKNSFSGFARYEQPTGRLKGVFATVGYIYRGTRAPQDAGRGDWWTIPSLRRLDLGLGYEWKLRGVRYTAVLNMKNAMDELLFADNNQRDRYVLLPPRTLAFTLRASF